MGVGENCSGDVSVGGVEGAGSGVAGERYCDALYGSFGVCWKSMQSA